MCSDSQSPAREPFQQVCEILELSSYTLTQTAYCNIVKTAADREIQPPSLQPNTKDVRKMANDATLLTDFCFVLENRILFLEKILFMFL